MRAKTDVIRIARSKDGVIVIDPTGKTPGRAAYVCKKAECLAKAKKVKGLERSFKGAVDPEIYAQLTEHLDM